MLRWPWPRKPSSHDVELGVLRDGYPAHAAWMAQDPDSETSIYRKFNRLSTRNLLFLQCRLSALEANLDTYDQVIRQSGDREQQASQLSWEWFEKRAKLDHSKEAELMALQVEVQNSMKEYRPSTQALAP